MFGNYIKFGDENLSQLMEYQLVVGRYFSKDFKTDTASVLINETAARLMGIYDPDGK
ncbi:MAG TPA: hypothetical protein PLI65_11575 [Bacteroidales bacterium]|nr:hypothetical protein [Bacteroidales bacterium]HPR58925.1 hypothetical protein [Bacteroidales bacterium]